MWAKAAFCKKSISFPFCLMRVSAHKAKTFLVHSLLNLLYRAWHRRESHKVISQIRRWINDWLKKWINFIFNSFSFCIFETKITQLVKIKSVVLKCYYCCNITKMKDEKWCFLFFFFLFTLLQEHLNSRNGIVWPNGKYYSESKPIVGGKYQKKRKGQWTNYHPQTFTFPVKFCVLKKVNFSFLKRLHSLLWFTHFPPPD